MEEKQQYTSFNSEFQKFDGIVNPVEIIKKAPKFSTSLEKAIFDIALKAEQEIVMRIKAMMWLQQDYNPKHYSVTFHPIDIKIENGSRVEIEREIEYHPPKRNGHRRNHAPSDIYKDIAEQVAQQDIQKNSPVQTPFGEEYGLMKQLGLK